MTAPRPLEAFSWWRAARADEAAEANDTAHGRVPAWVERLERAYARAETQPADDLAVLVRPLARASLVELTELLRDAFAPTGWPDATAPTLALHPSRSSRARWHGPRSA